MRAGGRAMHETRTTVDRAGRLRRLLALYLEDALEEVNELGRILAGNGAGDAPENVDGRARRIAHDLRGTGGSYGFDAVSERAGVLEDAMLDGEHGDRLQSLARDLRASVREAHALLPALATEDPA